MFLCWPLYYLFHLGILLHFHHFREQSLIFASISIPYPMLDSHFRSAQKGAGEFLASEKNPKKNPAPLITINCKYSKNNMNSRSYSCTSRAYKNLLEGNAVFVSSSALSGYVDIMIILTRLALIQWLCFFQCEMPFNFQTKHKPPIIWLLRVLFSVLV